MSNKKYSKSYKLDAVKMALSSAVSQAQVARELGLKEIVFITGSVNIVVKF